MFDSSTNPFIQAKATATNIGVSGAIFQNASQENGGVLQTAFNLANGFLDITVNAYVGSVSWLFLLCLIICVDAASRTRGQVRLLR